jgi:hypothetical protein
MGGVSMAIESVSIWVLFIIGLLLLRRREILFTNQLIEPIETEDIK